MLCPSPGCQIRVRVRAFILPLSPSPRVRVKKCFRVRVTNLVVHIFNICLSSKTWKQTTKCIECQSKQRNTGRPLLLGLGRDSDKHESRFLSPSPSKMDSSPSPYSSHTALVIMLQRILAQIHKGSLFQSCGLFSVHGLK